MRESGNYFPDIGARAAELVAAVGHTQGLVTREAVHRIARHVGFQIHTVTDVPTSTRMVTDLANRRIYLPARGGRDPRALEDMRDADAVSYETVAHRFCNLATQHLDLQVHFMRTSRDGVIYKAYENDGVRFPMDTSGAIEGAKVCRSWTARVVFDRLLRGGLPPGHGHRQGHVLVHCCG